uniref:Fibronectin type-III domain-containing protein n=1 Tax=Magallana gigas TaxID=29159 RepID=A0A8W8KLQ0_MAGGI
MKSTTLWYGLGRFIMCVATKCHLAQLRSTAKEKPSKPVGPLKVDDITEDQVKLSWKPPESDGGSKITSYIVEKCEARHPRWLRVARLPPGSLSVDCYNLIEGMDYFFSVAAENEAGVSSPLETDKPVTPKSKFGPPAAPTGPIKCTQITRDSVTIEWKPPKEDGGSRVTAYIIEKKEGLRHSFVHVSKTLSGETTLTVLGLNEGKDYYFRVYAENKYGKSPALEAKRSCHTKEGSRAPNVSSFSTCQGHYQDFTDLDLGTPKPVDLRVSLDIT